MDGLLEAKSEPKWKFLLRALHAAGVSKLWSVYMGAGAHACNNMRYWHRTCAHYRIGRPRPLRPTVKGLAS